MKIPAVASVRPVLSRWLERIGFPRDWFLIPLAALIGSLAGLAAQGYGHMVRFSERFFFGGITSETLSGKRLWLVVALPAAGALAVGLIKTLFRLPLISHGIPEVIEALARRRGVLRLRSAIFTALNSALTLGSGGSTGQEGPIIHIGSVVGSKTGQWLKIGSEHMYTLVGCGAAAGLSAIFNAPIAGVLLVLEVLVRDFSLKTFMPVVIASVFGVAVSQALIPHGSLFEADPEMLKYQFSMIEVLPYALLGCACGVLGYLFSRTLFAVEHGWARLNLPKVIQPMVGALVLGLMGLGFVVLYPNVIEDYAPPPFFGNGYPVIAALLQPGHYGETGLGAGALTLGFLVLLAACKLVGTSLSLGSGGSGGIFAPSLFIGAAAGAAVGLGLRATGLMPGADPAAYALAGMAGTLTATVHCPLTAMILVFEITQDYGMILPVMLVAIGATVVSQVLQRDGIYTLALREMGLRVGTMSDLTVLRRITIGRVPLTPAVVVHPDEPAQRLLDLAALHATMDFVVNDRAGRYLGMVVGEDLRSALLDREAVPLLVVGELMRTDLPTLALQDTLEQALDKFSELDVASLPVLSEGQSDHVAGLVTRRRLMRQYHEALSEPPGIA